VVIYCNTHNQRQYVLYYIECPSEGGIVEGGIAEGDIVPYIILYANFFDNSAISLVNVDVVFFSNFS
jgi:hypothetical protein